MPMMKPVVLAVALLALLAVSAMASKTKQPRSWVTADSFKTKCACEKNKAAAAPKNTSWPPVQIFTQRVDHYDATNTDTFSQRFTVDDSAWKPGQPAFIFLAGEASMEFFEFQEASAVEWAHQFGALYVSIEHRYYGQSLPTQDYSTPNMRFLSSEQALADAANFIQNFSVTHDINKWVVFGCSYSGALSSWFRLKYPHLVVGSVAPSGPVFASTDYTGYYGLFESIAPPSCVAGVKSAVQQISDMLMTAQGRSSLATTFKSCKPIPADPADQYYFLLSLTEGVGSSDQFENAPLWPLNATCATLTQNTNYVANWGAIMDPGAGQCNDFNEESGFLAPMRNVNDQDRSWFWQKCTEFGFFKPTDSSIFWPGNLTLPYQLAWCEEIFGIPNMAPDTDFTNAMYGGYDLHATNVLFTNGMFDPWHLLSINKPNQWGVDAVTYAAGHCDPMTAPDPSDPPSVTQARTQVGSFLQGLLA